MTSLNEPSSIRRLLHRFSKEGRTRGAARFDGSGRGRCRHITSGAESSVHFSACRFRATFYEAAYRLGRLRSAFYPVIHPLTVDLNISRITARIIIANRFDKATIALRTLLGDDNSIERLLLRASSS